jgi:hypothetical protein
MVLNIILLILVLSALPPCYFILTEKELSPVDGIFIDIIPFNSIFEITLAFIGLAILTCGLLQLKALTNYSALNILLGLAITALSTFIAIQFIRNGSFDTTFLHILGLILLAFSFGVISVALVQLKARLNKDDEQLEQLSETADVMNE